jgi:hypothetical protein
MTALQARSRAVIAHQSGIRSKKMIRLPRLISMQIQFDSIANPVELDWADRQ